MQDEDYSPRFTFEITEEQKQRANRVLSQYGLRKAIFGVILDDTLDLIEEYGGIVIGVLMSGKLKPREMIPSIRQAEEAGKSNVKS